MQNATDREVLVSDGFECAFFGEGTDADQPLRLQNLDDPAEVGVAGFVESRAFGAREFIRRTVASAFLHEDERAVVGDEMLCKEGFGLSPMARDCAPEPRTADFAPGASEALNRSPGMFVARSIDSLFDAQPVTDNRNLTKGHTRLGHAVGAWVHSEKEHSLLALPESS